MLKISTISTGFLLICGACSGADASSDASLADEGSGSSVISPQSANDNGTRPDAFPGGNAPGLPQGEAEIGLPTSSSKDSALSAGAIVAAEPSPPVVVQDDDVVDPSAPPQKPTTTATNPFVMVAHDPLSTFAVDVDSASYDLLRQSVKYGQVPNPGSVRLEEYVNYFKYDYEAPAADSEVPFSVGLSAAPHLLESGTTLLRVAVQGKLPPPTEKKPTNLVFLIDVSGSMQSQDKLPLVQKLLTESLTVLSPADTISIVTYAGNTGVRLGATPVFEADKIRATLDSLRSGGSTNGAGGIQLAYEQAESGFIKGGINHVVLCTDGDFNVGASSDEALVALIEEKRKTGVTFTALGFGFGNLNDGMMEATSNAGNGIYAVISDESHASRYVEERLLANLTYIAKDVKTQVEFNPEKVAAYRLLGYENRAIADVDFRNDLVDAGEIGAGHRVTALYELVLTGDAIPKPMGAPQAEDGDAFDGEGEIDANALVLVKLRYKQVDATETDAALEVKQSLLETDVLASTDLMDEDFQWAVAIAAYSELLKQSPYASAQSLATIRAIFEAQAPRDGDRTEFLGLFNEVEALRVAMAR